MFGPAAPGELCACYLRCFNCYWSLRCICIVPICCTWCITDKFLYNSYMKRNPSVMWYNNWRIWFWIPTTRWLLCLIGSLYAFLYRKNVSIKINLGMLCPSFISYIPFNNTALVMSADLSQYILLLFISSMAALFTDILIIGAADYDLTGQLVWPGAVLMNNYLSEHPETVKECSVIELGSGIGE